MPRLHLFAEGLTELFFATRVLKPHLADFEVWLQNPCLVAHARKKGRTHRGGGRHFEPMQNDIVRRLKRDRNSDVYFTTMVDLYALYNDFPGRSEAEKVRADPYKRVASLEESWRKKTADNRFIPYIQLHEFEAYLFADVSKFAEWQCPIPAITALQNVVNEAKSPERIDDGQHTAPSKRIIARFGKYKKLKTTIGPQMAEMIGLSAIRAKCPHLHEWIRRLERLGTGV